jgi:SAM-dependent methyltransferase
MAAAGQGRPQPREPGFRPGGAAKMAGGSAGIAGSVPGVAQTLFDARVAARYETYWPEVFEPAVIGPAVSFLAGLAGNGRALELAAGTGRLALPLARRGVQVHGIELSEPMAARLREQPGGDQVEVTIGDMATTTVGGPFRLAYLVRNTITNLTTQDEQAQCFQTVAAQLEPGGCFVVENYIPQLQRLPPGETTRVFIATPAHIGIEQYDTAAQIAVSTHYWIIDGQMETFSSPHRYLWPGELDLMAKIAGMRLRERWANWQREPFTSDSAGHISVWEKTG